MRIAVVAVASLALSAIASAQEAQPAPATPPPVAAGASAARPPMYLALRGGMYQPQSDDVLVSVVDDGLDLEALFGVWVSRYVAVEGGIGYYRTSTGTISETDPVLGTLTAKVKLSAIPITASVRAGTQVDRFSFSALAGVGIHMASLDMDVDMPGFFTGSLSDDDNVFGFHVGGTAAVRVGERASVGIELRRTWVEANLADEDTDLGGLRLGLAVLFHL